MIKFKPISNGTRRMVRDAMQSNPAFDLKVGDEGFDPLVVEEAMVDILLPLVAEWDFKSVETGEPIPLDDEHIYDLLSPAQTRQVMDEFGELASGKIPPKKGGR